MRLSRSLPAVAACLALLCLFTAPGIGQPTAFERLDLNAGLGIPPETVDRTTPQSAVQSFLDAVAAERHDAAAHLLNLNELEPEAQPELGPELARKLGVLIDRKVVIDWDLLLERPDSLNSRAPGDAPMAGEPRRSLLIGLLDLDDRPVAIRLNRVAPQDGADPAWVFSAQTVSQVDALHARYGPSEIEQALPEVLRKQMLWDLRLWELIGLPVLILGLVVTARAVYGVLGRLADDEHRPTISRIIRGLRLPVTVALITAITELATSRFFVVSGRIDAVLEPAIAMGYVASAMLVLVAVIDAALSRIVIDAPEDMSAPDAAQYRALATRISAARRAVVLVAVITGIGIVLATANVFRIMGLSLLASAGVMTLILAFAGREVLGNVLASMQISLNRSARIGDQVIFRGHWCTVERINLTFVQLRIWTGNRLVVPVADFVSESFENWSLGGEPMTAHATLKLAADADLGPLRDAFDAFVAAEDRVAPKDEARVQVTGQDALGMDVRFALPVPNPSDGWDVECRLREHLLAAARDRGTRMPSAGAVPEAA